MVFPLKEIIFTDDGAISEERIEFLDKIFSSFKCSRVNKDVEYFLKEKAIEFEKSKEAATFLVFDDEEFKKGNLKLTAFFSLALKVFSFTKDADEANKGIMGVNRNTVPAYLIGQLARSEDSQNGFGKTVLRQAISYIKSAQYFVGGKLVYLDCRDDLVKYYEKQGFKFIQKRKKADENGDRLNQMYIII
ncbi:MAG: hypothetical protein IJS93_03305 [Clostridia bacterium]|nr:hypothetical protein [Clostridia bacterium]